LQNIGIVCERGPEWSERLCGTCIKIKCAFWICIFLSPVHVSLTWDSSITKATKWLRKWQLEENTCYKWNFPDFMSSMFGSLLTQTELIASYQGP
jgi:hypothetical protein